MELHSVAIAERPNHDALFYRLTNSDREGPFHLVQEITVDPHSPVLLLVHLRLEVTDPGAAQRRQNMIDHIILTVADFERSVAFYAKALKPLGITNFTDYKGQDGHPDLKGFGDGKRAFFWLKEGKPYPQAVHVGFVAKNHAEVEEFYKAAVGAGGRSKEAPQTRPEYYPGYYATWVLDPDGHDIEVVHKS
jgi:catechol 2,3-dioxygenase-like lactoylglutathione lyase family enzyme